MKSTSTIKPHKYAFERYPRGGYILWLRENFHEFEDKIEGEIFNGWIYDEYTILIPFSLSDEFIEEHFEEYLAEARKKEAMDTDKRISAAEDAIADLAELIGGMCQMVKFYVNRIRQGKMTIEEVPEKWREEVRKIIGNDT